MTEARMPHLQQGVRAMLKCGAHYEQEVRDVSRLLGECYLRAVNSGNGDAMRYYERARWVRVGLHWEIQGG